MGVAHAVKGFQKAKTLFKLEKSQSCRMRFRHEVTVSDSHGREPVVCKSQTESPEATIRVSFRVVACRPFRTENDG